MRFLSIPSQRTDLAEAYDVIVLGGGPSGASASIALARVGFSVALLERNHFDDMRVGETLPGEIVRQLSRLGVWPSFLTAHHKPSPGTVSIWGDTQPYENDSLFCPYGAGWHLDRTKFDRILLEAAEAAGTSIYRCGRLDIYRGPKDRSWTVRTQCDGKSLSLAANWVIDATGRPSWLSRTLGVRKRVQDRLIALIAFSLHAAALDARTVIEAC